MQIDNVYKLGMAACLAVMLAACSSTGSDADAQAEQEAEAARQAAAQEQARLQAQQEAEAQAQAAAEQDRLRREQMREDEMVAITTFYFDFDQSDLKPEAREALVYHANRLRENSSLSVRLEGHADERGTREYNLALGERRAQAVERYLQVQGVPSRQLETVSYGEEMPVATGTSENAYTQNRRVELVYEDS